MRFLLFFLLLFSSLYAETAPRENYPVTSLYKITPKVDVVTGDYLEDYEDLVVAGCEPLSLRSFYNHFARYEERYGGWRINPECYFFANFEYKNQEHIAILGSAGGNISCFHKSLPGNISFDLQKQKGFCNYGQSGTTHPENTKITYTKLFHGSKKDKFQWEGKVEEASGCVKTFTSPMHNWLGHNFFKVKTNFSTTTYEATPVTWTPYHLQVTEERRPNGNIICYAYEPWRNHEAYPRPYLLSSITAYNSTKTKVLGSIKFVNNRFDNGTVSVIEAIGSDGRKATIHNSTKPLLTACRVSPGKPQVNYEYSHHYLQKVKNADGDFRVTEYDRDSFKVAVQRAPLGPNGELCTLSSYKYLPQKTEVKDAEGHLTSYTYDQDNRITLIQCGNRHERFFWDPTGNLLSRTLDDGQKILAKKEYTYDKQHNCIEEKLSDHVITRTYSENNLLLSEKEGDRTTHFSYQLGTNLPICEIDRCKDTITKRVFHTYDDSAICIKTIIDDGSDLDPESLKDVTFRTIIVITPKKQAPCMGLPETLEEKTIDAQGNEILLKKICYTYTPFGKVTKEKHYDSQNHHQFTKEYLYDENEKCICAIDALGNATHFGYDKHGNCILQKGKQLHKTLSYDRVHRPVTQTEQLLNGTILTTKIVYDKLGQVIGIVDPCGFITEYQYDHLGNKTLIVYPDGATEKKEYDVLGNPIKEIDAKGFITQKTYNHQSQVTSVLYPDQSKELFTYYPNGDLESHLNKNGAKTLYTYDSYHHIIKEETYSPNGELLKRITAIWSLFYLLSTTNAEGVTTTYTYNFAGQKISEKTADKQTDYFYDTLGRLCKTQEGDTYYTSSYDHLDRLIEKTTEDLKGNVFEKENYAYDTKGNRTKVIRDKGTTESFYDHNGHTLWSKNPLGDQTTYEYLYGSNFIKKVTNPKGIVTTFTYDSRHREKRVERENLSKKENVYDRSGNLIKETHTIYSQGKPIRNIDYEYFYGPCNRLEKTLECGKKETLYTYDSQGRLAIKTKPDKTQLHYHYDLLGRRIRYNSSDFDYTYTYDNNDQILNVYDSHSKTSTLRSYDALGHLLQETLANGLTLSNTYDPRGRRVRQELPDGSDITYSYQLDRLYQVKRKQNVYTYQKRDLQGSPTLIAFPQNLGKLTLEKDKAERISSISSPFYSCSHTYDKNSNITNTTYKDPLGKVEENYDYDQLDQLIQENSHTYLYDSLNNRLKKDEDHYNINDLCQITHDGQKSYHYDFNGNLINPHNLQYDNQDRLIRFEDIHYTYDPFHRRLSETRNGEKTLYLWDGQKEIGALKSGKITQLRILGEGFGAEIGAATLIELDQKSYLPIHDSRGCLAVLVDLKTHTPETYRYTAYGEKLTDANTSPWQFYSKRLDPTGFTYFGQRYYLPELGRWLTPDPEGFRDGPNLYAYVHNHPLTEIDLYGHFGIGQCFSSISRYAFKSLEWTSANLLPIPYVRGFVESVGRWGAGGNFSGPSNYRTGQNEIIPIPGKIVPGRSYTHGNGMLTHKDEAIKQAEYVSKTHGGAQVDLLYNGTEGLIMDLIGCGLSKLGMPTAYNRMCANYYINKLKEDPNHYFTSSVHSRGGIQLMNTGKLLSPDQRQHIDVLTYGSATLIPRGYFRTAENNSCGLDIVTMTNPAAFCMGLIGHQYNMNFLPPLSHCPLKVHGFLEETYKREINRRGKDFEKIFFND